MGATHILTFIPTTCGPFVSHSRPYSKLFCVLFKHVSASPTHEEGAAEGQRPMCWEDNWCYQPMGASPYLY